MNIYDEADWTEMDIERASGPGLRAGPRSKKRPIYCAAPIALMTWRANARSSD
jgi:hypothetical protein